MSQFEEENDLGRGGGEVEDETLDEAWEAAAERRTTANIVGDEAGLSSAGLGMSEEDAATERMMDDEDAGL